MRGNGADTQLMYLQYRNTRKLVGKEVATLRECPLSLPEGLPRVLRSGPQIATRPPGRWVSVLLAVESF